MRQYVMELMGTFFLTMAIIFAPGNPLAAGLMLLAMGYIGGHVSGAHLNPAVSLAVFIRGALKREVLFFYGIAQSAGAMLAHCLFKLLSGNVFPLNLSPDISIWLSFTVEVLLASVLALVVLTVTTTARYRTSLIDGTVVGLSFLGLIIIGGFLNPAVAIGGMLVSLTQSGVLVTWQNTILAIIAPLVGGVLAAFEFKYLNPNE